MVIFMAGNTTHICQSCFTFRKEIFKLSNVALAATFFKPSADLNPPSSKFNLIITEPFSLSHCPTTVSCLQMDSCCICFQA